MPDAMTDNQASPYEAAADELCNRISALIPEHPEILTLESAWDLFSVPGFKCDDLQPTMAQAMWALSKARAMHSQACQPTTALSPTEAPPDA